MSARYELIDAEKATVTPAGAVKYSIVKMCRWLDVSSSGYYEWRGRPVPATAARRDRLAVLIDTAFTDSDGTYGHRRIHAQLARRGEHAGLELVHAHGVQERDDAQLCKGVARQRLCPRPRAPAESAGTRGFGAGCRRRAGLKPTAFIRLAAVEALARAPVDRARLERDLASALELMRDAQRALAS